MKSVPSTYTTGSVWLMLSEGSVVGQEPRTEKLNCLPEPKQKLWIAAPAPFYFLPQTWRNFIDKNHGWWRSFCELLQFQSYYLSQKGNFQCTVSYRTIRSWCRRRNSDLLLCSAGSEAEINIFGSTTLSASLGHVRPCLGHATGAVKLPEQL